MELSEKSCELESTKISQQKAEYKKLLSKFSHEIRNPLTLVNSSLQLLEKEYPDLQTSPLWPQIKQDLGDILSLLQDMSALNNIDVIRRSYFTVENFLKEIENSFTSFMQEKNINFILSSDRNASPVQLFADKYKLREAIVNLLLNAVDAVSVLPQKRTIFLFADLNDAEICFHVQDNGPGIPDTYMETLFEPFITHKQHGTGLGLGIAKSIAQQHGGHITLNTCTVQPDTYTHFCLHLPLCESST